MQVSKYVKCEGFHCADVKHDCYVIPGIDVKPRDISIVLISEAAPANPNDYYYAEGDSLFQQTTVQAFNDAGMAVSSVQDILNLGVYLTTAVKCGKTGYGIKTSTIKECSLLLEKELALFPDVRVFLLMGDVAIKAVNDIAKSIKNLLPPKTSIKVPKTMKRKTYLNITRRGILKIPPAVKYIVVTICSRSYPGCLKIPGKYNP